ncbi:MAG TPA: hypothetical protein VHM90_19730 [Phycisphaerae bacterium]|nr:hypothetical protein [Phycisphaerae bacterium]
MNIILCTDLIFSTKITGTAKALNQPYAVARTLDKLRELLDATPAPHKIILDLNITALDPLAAIQLAKSHPSAPHITAFLSHVQVELAAAARTAGADRVLPLSTFTTELPQILSP